MRMALLPSPPLLVAVASVYAVVLRLPGPVQVRGSRCKHFFYPSAALV